MTKQASMKFNLGDEVVVVDGKFDYKAYNGCRGKVIDIGDGSAGSGEQLLYWELDLPPKIGAFKARFHEHEIEHAAVVDSPLYKALG